MKKLPIIFGLFCALLLLSQGSFAQVTYRIQKLTNGSYKASMKSATAYSGSAAQISNSFQFTVLIPTGSGTIQNLTNMILSGGSGVTTAPSFGFNRTNAPSVNSSKDYIFFKLNNTPQFDIAVNTEIDLFTFEIAGSCLGNLDLFVNGTTPTPVGLNAGNNISIVGAGPGNQYTTNYGTSAPCAVGNPDITIALSAPSTAVVGTNFNYVYTVSNDGAISTTGTPITLTSTLPAGLSFVSGTGTGWVCSATGQNVTCTSSNVIAPSASNTVTFTVTPTVNGTFNTLGSIVGGGDTTSMNSNTVSTTTGCTINAGSLTRL
ncbi:hypothetical protein LV89_04346 [Arcicella aurantiaca]|uniref:DUF11 domain-containing protein n=1 Tax=Arcicella aurantiaca TaxID=591202 RepID=A0A316E410_9BACT|nr:DUF11 domain-containing protein [Arcicella aurantiaca]PWK17630.1 hypothetical protein LV89_04346 [Arcicella aurantiaca]